MGSASGQHPGKNISGRVAAGLNTERDVFEHSTIENGRVKPGRFAMGISEAALPIARLENGQNGGAVVGFPLDSGAPSTHESTGLHTFDTSNSLLTAVNSSQVLDHATDAVDDLKQWCGCIEQQPWQLTDIVT